MKPECDLFWGSHGCSLPPDHSEPYHVCQALEYDEDENLQMVGCCRIVWDEDAQFWRVGYLNEDTDQWEPGVYPASPFRIDELKNFQTSNSANVDAWWRENHPEIHWR